MEEVILVDGKDREVWREEKIKAHREKKLHRAFSVFVFNKKGEVLLQRRAWNKYHSAGLWSNSCCSHPRPGESVEMAAHRRLREEMGFDCDLREVFGFVYKAKLENGLGEYEYDHVLIGNFDGVPMINTAEVAEWKWVGPEWLEEDLKENRENYTAWLKKCLGRVRTRWG